MEYFVAIYPLLLTVVMYICIQQHARGCRVLVCLWKPFGYCFVTPQVTRKIVHAMNVVINVQHPRKVLGPK